EIEVTKRGLIVTQKGFELKQKDLRNILEVEIPNNSKEIGFAMAKGDLRENAEYKAALEKQDFLKSACSKLQDDLHNAQIFDVSQVDVKKVSFGTKVRMKNINSNEEEEYTILGPWESDPSSNVISYMSPLGTKIINHKINEDLEFTINEKDFHYKIISIEKGI
ncbi:MAG: transcription elongation factor GreA, partial [Spirochaetales bacterium]|nr:transcription elongation factor GreA [Spirochaetales bacterium]